MSYIFENEFSEGIKAYSPFNDVNTFNLCSIHFSTKTYNFLNESWAIRVHKV